MTDYISREAAIAEQKRFCGYLDNDMLNRLEIATRKIPAADVRPVVRGKWLTGNDNPRTYGRIRAMCGRCGAFALADMVNAGSYKERLSNFCPNCGADMREENNG